MTILLTILLFIIVISIIIGVALIPREVLEIVAATLVLGTLGCLCYILAAVILEVPL